MVPTAETHNPGQIPCPVLQGIRGRPLEGPGVEGLADLDAHGIGDCRASMSRLLPLVLPRLRRRGRGRGPDGSELLGHASTPCRLLAGKSPAVHCP